MKAGRRMLHTKSMGQAELEAVYIEQLVGPDHLLRKIQEHVDFSFIIDEVRGEYSANKGRPSEDPIVLFKILLIGYLFGIRSERRLLDEVRHNVAYRWFLGLKLTDPVPSPSCLWQNRKRRHWTDEDGEETEHFRGIFDKIVLQAVKHGFVDGQQLVTDGTLIKANANKKKFEVKQVEESTREYLGDLHKAIQEDREAHGLKPLPEREQTPEVREVKQSTTDPDAGRIVRPDKPEMFAYTEHRTVDNKHNFVVDVHVTPATVVDAVPYTSRVERIVDRFGFEVKAVALDAGYLTAWIAHWLSVHSIFGVIGYRRFQSVKGMMPKVKFTYDDEADVYHCPGNSVLTYRTTNREGYREYTSDPKVCAGCLLRPYCTKSKANKKTVTRHVWEGAREQIRQNRLTPEGKDFYARRKETIERSFADAKELHGMRYARMRGLHKVREQCLMTAMAQNLKKLANLLDRSEKRALPA